MKNLVICKVHILLRPKVRVRIVKDVLHMWCCTHGTDKLLDQSKWGPLLQYGAHLLAHEVFMSMLMAASFACGHEIVTRTYTLYKSTSRKPPWKVTLETFLR